MHTRVLALVCAFAVQAAPAADEVVAMQSARSLAATCAACHGTDGRSDVPGTPVLAGLERDLILTKLKGFRDPAFKGDAMHHLANGYTAEQEAMLATYFASLSKEAR